MYKHMLMIMTMTAAVAMATATAMTVPMTTTTSRLLPARRDPRPPAAFGSSLEQPKHGRVHLV